MKYYVSALTENWCLFKNYTWSDEYDIKQINL